MDYYQYSSARTTPTYPSYTNQSDNSNQRYMDSYGRTVTNPLPAIFRTATITTNSPPTPIATARVQQFSNYRPVTSHSTYDTPRNYHESMTNGYASDTNELRRSSISIRPMNGTTSTNFRPVIQQQPKVTASTEQNYYSDSEYVTSGPRYYKISRQVNSVRRPSNVVLPIRSIISKAYDQYMPSPEPPKPQQQPFDVYRYQQEQQCLERERERQEQLQRQAAAARYNPPPKVSFTNNHEIGAELLKSPLVNSNYLFSRLLFLTKKFSFQKNVMPILLFSKPPITLIPPLKNRKRWHIKSLLFSKVVIEHN